MPSYPHPLTSKLPRVGTTIFTVMSRLAAEHRAINLSQGFPDFDCAPELRALAGRLGVDPSRAIAIGDGANDLKMMHAAGMGIAYRAKPVVRQQATHALNFSGLDGVLNLFASA